jgi:hypothetical protein
MSGQLNDAAALPAKESNTSGPLNVGLGGDQILFRLFGKEEDILTLPGVESGFLEREAQHMKPNWTKMFVEKCEAQIFGNDPEKSILHSRSL